MRTDEKATWDAEMQTGTRRLSACSRFGVRDRYGMPYRGTGTERYPSVTTMPIVGSAGLQRLGDAEEINRAVSVRGSEHAAGGRY